MVIALFNSVLWKLYTTKIFNYISGNESKLRPPFGGFIYQLHAFGFATRIIHHYCSFSCYLAKLDFKYSLKLERHYQSGWSGFYLTNYLLRCIIKFMCRCNYRK